MILMRMSSEDRIDAADRLRPDYGKNRYPAVNQEGDIFVREAITDACAQE